MAIFMLILFQINSVLLIGFYTKFTSQKVMQNISTLQDDFTKLNEEMVDILTLHSGDDHFIETYLRDYAERHQISINVLDRNGKVLFTFDYLKGLYGYKSKEFVLSSGQINYIIEATYKIDVFKIRDTGAFKDIRNFSFVTIGFSFLITIFFFYFQVAKPVKMINQQIDQIDGRTNRLKFNYYFNDELGDLCRNFEGLEQRLVQAHEEQRLSLEAINHDLRTPLTSIFGYIDMLIRKENLSEEKKQKYISIINRKVRELTFLLDELAIIQLDVLEINKEPVIAKDIFREICESYTSELAIRNIQFMYNLKIDPEQTVYIDTNKLMRVLSNLIDNSIKYAGDSFTITLNIEIENENILIDYYDDGVGISDSELDKVFDRFWRAEKSRSRASGGYGLGLSICQSIVVAMNGNIMAYKPSSIGFGLKIQLPSK